MARGSEKRRSIFFFNDTATTEIYTLSLHDALPISATANQNIPHTLSASSYPTSFVAPWWDAINLGSTGSVGYKVSGAQPNRDRKSTRLNSSHANISYAVFCLKKKTRTATCV